MKQLAELRPNKNLLNPDFNGYKLSLADIPLYNLTLSSGVDQVFPSDDQYSFLHAKIFSLHNYLHSDPWTKNTLYYIDKKWKVQKIVLCSLKESMEKVEEVWEIPSNHSRVPGHYNPTLQFPTSDLAVVGDGAGTLHVVSRTDLQWEVKYSEEVVGTEKPFLVLHSACEQKESQKLLHCILAHVESEKDNADENLKDKKFSHGYVTFIEWITLIQEASGNWSMKNVRQMRGAGLPDYVVLEPGCQSLYIVNEFPFKFVSDSENPVTEEASAKEKQVKKVYLWQQNSEDIRLTFALKEGVTKNDINISAKGDDFQLDCKGNTIISGSLFHRVDNDLTTWSLQDNKLEVVLQKEEHGLMWKEFIIDNNEGEEILDETVISEVHELLSHLCSDTETKDSEIYGSAPSFNMEQLEDCDNVPGECKVLMRLDGVSHRITHQYTLAGHQWLFSVQQSPETVPAICVRHDVDGCVWQPKNPEDSNVWPCTHISTFLAFGYVQASKQNRKFLICPPDMSYTAVCEGSNHIFVYRQAATIEGELRNRRTGSRINHVGTQHLIRLDSTDPILGAVSTNNYLFILQENNIKQYRIN